MIVNFYLSEGKYLSDLVDESTKHQLGDSIRVGDNQYTVIKVTESEHIDYQTVVRVNEVVPSSHRDAEEALY